MQSLLEIASLHVEVVQQLAALVDLHLLVDVPHVGVHGVRRYHQLLGHVVRGVAARDEHEDLGLAP